MVRARRFEKIIIDLDGTLIEESPRLEAQAFAVSEKFGSSHKSMQATIDAFFTANDRAVAEGGRNKNNIPLYMRWIGESFGLEITEEESEVLAEAWVKAYEESLQTPVLFADSTPFLEGLKEYGYEPLIATGGQEAQKRKLLEEVGLNGYVKKVFATDDIGYQKQDVRFWHQVLANLAVSPEKILVVGNQINDDVWRTSELGLSTVLVKRMEVLHKNIVPKNVLPTYEVTDLRDILKLI